MKVFELELIHRDEVNVAYILQLLLRLKSQKQKDALKTEKVIFNLLSTEATPRSKKELIEKFIEENLPFITDADGVVPAFEEFWAQQRAKELAVIVAEENLVADKTEKLIEDYLFAEWEPFRDELLDLVNGEKPGLLQRKKTADRILQRIKDFIEKFINGMAE